MTPQIQAYQRSSLGMIMSKIGLTIGVDTGDSLVKLIQPSESDRTSNADPTKCKKTNGTSSNDFTISSTAQPQVPTFGTDN